MRISLPTPEKPSSVTWVLMHTPVLSEKNLAENRTSAKHLAALACQKSWVDLTL